MPVSSSVQNPAAGAESTKAGLSQHPVPSTGPGQDMVRSLALMFMAALMAAVVLVTDRMLLSRVGFGHVLSWLVLWTVLLSALMALSRLSVVLSQAVLAWADRASLRAAQAKSIARRATLAS
ncbi:MAG TPA: hypothetical protein PK347_13610 [Burkholderiaceae bacterium]|nr:hypothetical protein [Burkholderiaceae bacterium]